MKKFQCFFAVVLIGWTISFMGCQKASHILEPVSTEEETSVKFPDVNLANEVRKALDLPKGADITKSKLGNINNFTNINTK